MTWNPWKLRRELREAQEEAFHLLNERSRHRLDLADLLEQLREWQIRAIKSELKTQQAEPGRYLVR